MGIMERFKDIMSANINALLDKAEDPEKMIDQYLRNMESDLGKVKAETATVIAEESRAKRALDECNANIAKMQTYAEKAITAGNDNDARQFLAQKKVYSDQLVSLQNTYQMASDNAAKMRNMHDKLVNDINELNARRDAIKAKMAAAKTQQRINKIGSSTLGITNDMSAFEKMEAKANKLLDVLEQHLRYKQVIRVRNHESHHAEDKENRPILFNQIYLNRGNPRHDHDIKTAIPHAIK